MELRRRYHLRQLLHVCRFDIDNVKTLIGDLQVPEVDSEIVSGEISLLIRVHRNRVYVVGVSVGEDSSGGCFNHEFHWFDAGDTQRIDARWIQPGAILCTSIVPGYNKCNLSLKFRLQFLTK